MEKDNKPREIGKQGKSNIEIGGKYTAPLARFDLEVLAEEHIGPRNSEDLKIIKSGNRVSLRNIQLIESYE